MLEVPCTCRRCSCSALLGTAALQHRVCQARTKARQNDSFLQSLSDLIHLFRKLLFFWVMMCGISYPVMVSSDLLMWSQGTYIETVQAEGALPRRGLCQIARSLAWAAATMPAKELSILPACPLHPEFPEQFECCVIAVCHLEICTGSHIFYSENEDIPSSAMRALAPLCVCPLCDRVMHASFLKRVI